jgi:hypothetical protein
MTANWRRATDEEMKRWPTLDRLKDHFGEARLVLADDPPHGDGHHHHEVPADKPALVRTIGAEVDIYLDAHGFYAQCTASACAYVTEYTASKSTATQWATAHYEGQPGDGRAG